MLAFMTVFSYIISLTMCYQRPSVNHNTNTNNNINNNNHHHFDQKPTHQPHYGHGYKWTEPYFDVTMPRNITSLVGKSAYLGCRVRNLGNKTVAWIRHRDLHILTVGTYTYTTDERFQTAFHRDIDEWTLQIKWAQKRDAGAYECQISTQPVRSFSVTLNIVDAINFEVDNIKGEYFNDDSFSEQIQHHNQKITDEFAGIYGYQEKIAVPTATILGGPDLYVDKGSTINLTCAIKFSPEPPTHIFWYHQDKVVSEDSSRGKITFFTNKNEATKSILLIDDADLQDSGKYSCYPSNTEIASIRVHVLNGERPEAMQTSSARNKKIFYLFRNYYRNNKEFTVIASKLLLITLCIASALHILITLLVFLYNIRSQLRKYYYNYFYYYDSLTTTTTTTVNVLSMSQNCRQFVVVDNHEQEEQQQQQR